jgi:hypothetical protein
VFLLLGVIFVQSAEGPISNVFQSLLSYGVLGAVVIAAMFGRVDLNPAAGVKREDYLRGLNDELVAAFQTQALPALHGSVETLRMTSSEITKLRDEVINLRLEVKELRAGR